MGCCKCEEYGWEEWQEVITKDEEGNEYCIFHAPAELKEGMEDEFEYAVQKRLKKYEANFSGAIFAFPLEITPIGQTIDFTNCIFKKQIRFYVDKTFNNQFYCNFKNAIFEDDVDFSNISARAITCSYATFTKKADFSFSRFQNICSMDNIAFWGDVIFTGTVFHSESDFQNSIFYKEADFTKCIFVKKINFSKTIFISKVSFLGSIFEKEAQLDCIKFQDRSNFFRVHFKDIAIFRKTIFQKSSTLARAVFSKHVSFTEAIVEEELSFKGAAFDAGDGQNINFSHVTLAPKAELNFTVKRITCDYLADQAKLEGRVIFDDVRFPSKVSFIETILGHASFRRCKFNEPPVFDRADLRRVEFIGAPVEDFRLMACTWPESKGRRVTYDGREVGGKGFFKLDNINEAGVAPSRIADEKVYHLEDLYRRLKKVARAETDEQLASDFHYAEKEMQRLSLLAKVQSNTEERNSSSGIKEVLRDICNTVKFYCKNRYDKIKKVNVETTKPDFLVRSKDIRDWFLYCVLTLYKVTSEYGEGPSRAGLILGIAVLLPLIFFFFCGWLLPVVPTSCSGAEAYATISAWAVPSRNAFENWLQFLPLARVPEIGGAGWAMRFIMIVGQLAITIQAALFGFALRNRFRR